jgi:TorA maturation chaperone TorD
VTSEQASGRGAAAVSLPTPLAPEEQARAEVYALLAGLYSTPPDAALLHALGDAPRLPEEALGLAWPAAFNRLADASSVMDADAAAQEYTDLFVGVGRSEVDLHASHWLRGGTSRPLADLRGALAELGLARRDDASLMEDHLGALLETMRLLIAGAEGVAPAGVAAQRAFFERWIGSWADPCCTAIADCGIANYYRRVAECTKVFLAIERDSFAIE